MDMMIYKITKDMWLFNSKTFVNNFQELFAERIFS